MRDFSRLFTGIGHSNARPRTSSGALPPALRSICPPAMAILLAGALVLAILPGLLPAMAITVTNLTNTPDPFTPSTPQTTSINFTIDTPGDVHIAIYDASGNIVRRLFSASYTTSGDKTVVWDGNDDTGAAAPAGTYTVKVKAGLDLVYNCKIQGTGNFFSHPTDICTDSSGNVYVADTYGNRIHKYNSSGNLVWTKGTKGSGGSVGGEPQLTSPFGICTDGTYLYLADTANKRIQRLDMDGYVDNPGWYSHSPSDEGSDPYTRLMGMDFYDGRVYVAVDQGSDGSNNPSNRVYIMRILASDPSTTQRSQKEDWGSYDDKPGCVDVAVCPNGNKAIMTTPVYAINGAASGKSSVYCALTPDKWGNANENQKPNLNGFGRANNVWFGLSRYTVGTTDYILFTDTDNDLIDIFNTTGGGSEATIAGFSFGGTGTGAGSLTTPTGIACSYSGSTLTMWVSDGGNNRIQKFTNDGTGTSYVTKVESNTTSISHPTDLFIDSSRNLYVASTGDNTIVKFDQYGNEITRIGQFGIRPGEDVAFSYGRFADPQGVCVDASGNIYIADTQNERIFKYTSGGSLDTSFDAGDGYGGVMSLNGQWGGTNATDDDFPYGMDISNESPQRIFWLHGMDMDSGVARCALDGSGLDITDYSIPCWRRPGVDAVVSQTAYRLFGTGRNKDPRGNTPTEIGLYRFDMTSLAAGTDIFGAGNQKFTGIAKDPWDNIFVCSEDNNRLEVYRVMDTDYPTATDAVTTTPLLTEGSFGKANGQFDVPSGVAIDPLGQFLWVSDYWNNRIQKFDMVYSSTGTEYITIGAAGAPTVTGYSISGSVVSFYADENKYYSRAGTGVEFTFIFSKAMDTSVTPTSWFKTLIDGYEFTITAKSGAGYTNGWLDSSTNTWAGIADVPTGHDGTAALYIKDATDGTLPQTPNPDYQFSFTIDTVAPSPPTLNQPTSPTTDESIQVTGTSEAMATLYCYNYSAATGGTVFSQQMIIPVDPSGNWIATSMDLDVIEGNENWMTAVAVDRAGNASAYTTPRREVIYTLKQPGNAVITPPDDRPAGYSGQWTIRYIAAQAMTNGTITIRIPPGWSVPHETPGLAGYVTVSAGTGMTLLASPNDIAVNPGGTLTERDIVVSFSACTAGSYFDVLYGATNPPGSQIGATATLGNNIFLVKSAESDADHNGDDDAVGDANGDAAWSDMTEVNDPFIYVYGEALQATFTDSLSGVSTVVQGKAGQQILTLKFTNYNLGAASKVTAIKLLTQTNTGASIPNPSQYVTKMVVKDLATTYLIKNVIEATGGQIVLSMTSSPITIAAGSYKTIQIIMDVSTTAPAGNWLRFQIPDNTYIDGADVGSGLSVDVVAESPQTYPFTTSPVQIIAGLAAANVQVFHTDTMPDKTSKGATALQPFQLKFTNPTSGSYDLKVVQLVLDVESEAGTGIVPSSVLTRIKLEKADGTLTYLVDSTIEGSGSTMTLDLSLVPIVVPYGSPVGVNVQVDVSPTTTQPNFRLNLKAIGSVTAIDSVGGTPIAAASDPSDPFGPGVDTDGGGGGFPDLPSDEAIIQSKAVATIDTVTVVGTPATLLTGTIYEVDLNIAVAAGGSDAYIEPSTGDLKFIIGGVDKTSEFTVTLLSTPARITAGTTFVARYQVVQDLGASTGAITIDAQNMTDGDTYNRPALYDWNDHIDTNRLDVSDNDGATTPYSGTVGAPTFLVQTFAVGNNTASAGESRVEIIDLRITNSSGAADTITGITINDLGTILDTEVVSVGVYGDATDDGDAAGETEHGTAALSGGSCTINFGTPINLANGATVNLLVAYNLSATVVDGRTIDAQIPLAGINLGTAADLAAFVVNSTGVTTVAIVADRIRCYPSGSAGTGGFYVVNVRAEDSTGNVDTAPTHVNVTVTLSGSLGGSPTISGTTLSGGTPGGATVNGNLVSGAATVTITDATAEDVDVTPGSLFATNTACTVTFSNLFIVSALPVTPGTFAPGTADIEVMNLSMTNSTGGNVTLNSMVLNNIGSAADSEIASVKAWLDNNGDGLIDGGDTQLGAGTFSGGAINLNLGNQVLGAGNHNVLIGFTLNTGGLTDHHTLDAQLPINGLTYNTSAFGPAGAQDSAGAISIQVTASKIVVTAADGLADVLDTEVLTVRALDAWNNIDVDYSDSITVTCTGDSGNHGTIQTTTMIPGPIGSQVTNAQLTSGQATITITDDLAETVQVTPDSPFAPASDIGVPVVFNDTPPQLLSITVIDNQHIRLAFSKKIQATQANTQTNYIIYEDAVRTSFLSVVDAAVNSITYTEVTLTIGEMRYPSGAPITYVVECLPDILAQSGKPTDCTPDDVVAPGYTLGGDNGTNDASFNSVGVAPPADTNIQLTIESLTRSEEGGALDVKYPNFITFPAWSPGVGTEIAYTSTPGSGALADTRIYKISASGTANDATEVTDNSHKAFHGSRVTWDESGYLYFCGWKTVGTKNFLRLFKIKADGTKTGLAEVSYVYSNPLADLGIPWYDPHWVSVSRLPAGMAGGDTDRIFCSAAGDIRAIKASGTTGPDIVELTRISVNVVGTTTELSSQYKNAYAFQPAIYGTSPNLKMLFAYKHQNSWASDIYLLNGVNDILIGNTSPVTDLAADTRIVRVTNNGNACFSPSFSPDGTICCYEEDITGSFNFSVFQVDPAGSVAATNFNLYLQDLTDADANGVPDYPRDILSRNPFNESFCMWAPTGDRIISTYFTGSAVNDQVHLNVMGIRTDGVFGANGGALIDHGFTRMDIGTGQLQNDTKISIDTPTLVNNPAGQEEFLAFSGIARTFYPLGASFGTDKVELRIPYPDVDNDGYVDGSSPALDEAKLRLYYWDDAAVKWVEMGGTVYTTDNYISVPITHFSTYGIFGKVSAKAGAPVAFTEFYNYPNPARDNGGTSVKFKVSQTARVEIRIFDKAGDLVRKLLDEDRDPTLFGADEVKWDLTDEDGRGVANGVYIMRARVTSAGETSERFNKIAVLR